MAMGGKAGEVFTEINVTPLTDVFLVLLVIMILIAPLVNQTVLKMNQPGGPPSKISKEQPKIEALVSAEGQIRINGNLVNGDTLSVMTAIRHQLARANMKTMPLILKADKEAKQKFVVAVMDGAAGCNLQNASILVLDSAQDGKRR
jgi:biopolymer transport protein ExbD/biopolymer transport protein TolR